jgi:hypothetical protein
MIAFIFIFIFTVEFLIDFFFININEGLNNIWNADGLYKLKVLNAELKWKKIKYVQA